MFLSSPSSFLLWLHLALLFCPSVGLSPSEVVAILTAPLAAVRQFLARAVLVMGVFNVSCCRTASLVLDLAYLGP